MPLTLTRKKKSIEDRLDITAWALLFANTLDVVQPLPTANVLIIAPTLWAVGSRMKAVQIFTGMLKISVSFSLAA